MSKKYLVYKNSQKNIWVCKFKLISIFLRNGTLLLFFVHYEKTDLSLIVRRSVDTKSLCFMTEKTSKNVLNGQFVMTLGYLWFKIEIRGQKATWIFLADFCSRLKKTMVKFFVWTFRDQSNTKNSSNDLHF